MKRRWVILTALMCSLSLYAGINLEFFKAAQNGNLAAVKRMVESGIDVNSREGYGRTALMFAAENGHLDVMKYLIGKGAAVNQNSLDCDMYPIHFALSGRHEDAALLLMEKGADIKVRDCNGRTVLMYTGYGCSINAAKRLVKSGADINAVDNEGSNVFIHAASCGCIKLMEYLLSLGVNINTQNDPLRYTAIINVCQTLKYMKTPAVTVKFLIDHGADVNRVTASGYSALTYAVIEQDIEIVKLLLKAGADPRINNYDASVIEYAFKSNNKKLIRIIFDSVKDVKGKWDYRYTPLIYSVWNEEMFDILQYIVERGADVNERSLTGYGYRTPLMYAAERNNLKALEYLLKKGADFRLKDQDGKTALMLAAEKENTSAVEILKRAGAAE